MAAQQGLTARDASRPYQPITAICVACVSGIVIDRYAGPLSWSWIFLAIAGTIAWGYSFCRKWVHVGGCFVLAAVMGTGGLWHHLHWRVFRDDDIGLSALPIAQPMCAEAIALNSPKRIPAPEPDPLCTFVQDEESELAVRVVKVRNGSKWQQASGRALLTVQGRLESIQAGDQLRLFADLIAPPRPLNPGETSSAGYDRSERRLCRLRADSPRCVIVERASVRWRMAFWLDWIRHRCDGYLWRYVRHPRAGLSAAVLLGSREQIGRERNEDFMTTGTVHLLAISGLNVGILAYAFWIAERLGWISRRVTSIAAIIFAVTYAMLTRAEPPVVRAAVLVTVMCAARLSVRHLIGFNTLAIAGIVVLLINPCSLFQVGAQLSFLAVAIMAYIPLLSPSSEGQEDPLRQLISESRPRWIKFMKRLAGMVWEATVLSAVIWLATLPLVWHRFHLISPIATVLNPIVCVPMAVALFAGFGVMVFGWFAPPLAAICGWICDLGLWGMEWSIQQALRIPGNHFWGPAPPIWWTVLFYVALSFVLYFFSALRTRWITTFVVVWLSFGGWLVFGPRSVAREAQKLECTFIAVGHGTSVLVELPQGEKLLYDAGRLGSPHSAGRPVSAVLWSRGITHLDAVIVSHADADHFNAIPYLCKRFSIGVIYVSPTMFDESQPAVQAFRQAIDDRRIPVRELSDGDRLQVGADCSARVIHPPPEGVRGSDNANSIVLSIEYAGRRLLLPGDLESPGMESLLNQPSLACDVAMAPHHGSARSSPAEFASWTKPGVVVVSSSAARDSPLVRRIYQQAGAKVFRTAFDGAIHVEVAAGVFAVRAFRNDALKINDSR